MAIQTPPPSTPEPLKYVIDASQAKAVPPEALDGTTIERGYGVSGRYLLKEGRPWLPAIGEVHYLRIPSRSWEDVLERVRLGGIDVVGTYVFWNHHEEVEGKFDWSGDRDLRKFVRLCQAKGLKVLLRVGPFAHGEARNGALPDWLYARGVKVRSNDSAYLRYVERFYREVAKQVGGLLADKGGPIIGIQIENEYEASGAPWETDPSVKPEWTEGSREGAAHILKLQTMLKEAGLKVPFYTCTAWSRSPIPEGIVPMHSCYPVNFWSTTPENVYEPKGEYKIVDRWADPGYGEGGVAYDPATRPFLMVEMGVGMQPTLQHRPYVPPEMSDAVSRAVLGGGSNTLGYYMYAGGTQMVGVHSFLNEGTLPRLNYDYQAPLGEYGDFNASFYRLRPLHYFLRTFGASLAPMKPIVPQGAQVRPPSNVSEPEYSVRSDGRSAFLFLSNYQTGVSLNEFKGLAFDVRLRDRTVSVSGVDLGAGVTAILPVNLDLGGPVLNYSTAEPIDHLTVDRTEYWLFGAVPGMEAKFVFDPHTLSGDADVHMRGDSGLISLTSRDGRRIVIVLRSREFVERVLITEFEGRKRWLHSDLDLISAGDRIVAESSGASRDLSIFPDPKSPNSEPFLSRYPIVFPGFASPELKAVPLGDNTFSVKIPELPEGASDVMLTADYLGDHAFAYIDGQLVADDYTVGQPWRIRLGRLRVLPWGKELILRFRPLTLGTPPAVYVKRRRAARGLDAADAFHLDSMRFSVIRTAVFR